MDVAGHLGAGLLTMDVAVVVAILPELLALASQFARGHLLQYLEKLRQQNLWRLIHEQVHMLGHQDISIDPRLVPCARLFQHNLNSLPGDRRIKQRKTVKATEGDEMKRFRLLESFQADGHETMLDPFRPLIAMRPR